MFDGNVSDYSGGYQPPKPPKVSYADLAADAVLEADGDTSESAEIFLRRLRQQYPAIYDAKATEAMQAWAQGVVRNARSSLRNRIATAPMGATTVAHQALNAASIRAVSIAWFDWPVLPGVALRDATKTDLLQATEKYLGDAAVYMRRGNWLQAIAEAMPDEDQTVSDALTEDAIAQMAAQFGVSSS